MRSLVDFGTLCVAGMRHTGCVLNADEVLGMDESTVLVLYMHKIMTVAMRSTRNDQAELEGALLQIAKMTSVLVRHAGSPGLAVAQFPRQAVTVFCGKALQNFVTWPACSHPWTNDGTQAFHPRTAALSNGGLSASIAAAPDDTCCGVSLPPAADIRLTTPAHTARVQ